MIKLTGPAELQPLSLGKLCSFVQKALNQNILIYYKTLLIRNNQYDGVCSNTSTEAKNSKKVEILKEQILSLLRENKNGLSLAQIPLMLKNKYKKTYNIQSLGFPKLKNLLATMDEVDLEKTQGNFLKAVLKVHCRKNSDKNLDEMYKSNLAGKKFHTLRPKPLDNRLNSMHYNSNLQANLLSNDSAPPVKAYRTVSTLDDYIFKIQSTVLDILRLNIFGIEVEKLKAELDRRLGADFHYGIAKVNSFQEFLINYLGDYLDIEIKKSLRTGKSAGPLSHIVYPKNYKLPQPPKNYFPEEDAEEQQVGNLYEKFSNMSPGSLQHYLQSPDLSFANNLKQFCSPKHQAEDDLKISQSFNVGRNCEGARLFADTLSQQAGSSVGGHSGAQAPLSTKSTRFVNEYTHFGKLHVLKGSKIYTNEFRQRIKDASRTTAVSKKLDEGAGSNDRVCLVSFDNEEEAPQARGDSDRKNTEQVTVSKSTVNNEEASDEDPSLRVVANLLLDED